MNKLASVLRTALFVSTLILSLSHCRQEPGQSPSSSARQMRLGSNYSEIVVNSTKVPGYWAREFGEGERFFLYTLDRSFKRGDVINVEGAYGTARAAVFDDDTRVYQGDHTTNIFVVWKAVKTGPANDERPASTKVREK
jgi:hypothetical protein